MTTDNEGNSKIAKKKEKVGTTVTNDSASTKKNKKTKGRVEKASTSDNDAPKQKKAKGQIEAKSDNKTDVVKKKKKAKTRTGVATGNQDGVVKKKKGEAGDRTGKDSGTSKKKKSKNQNESNVKTNTGNSTATKKKKTKNSPEKVTANGNDIDRLPQYVAQSTTQNRSLPMNLSSATDDNQSSKEGKTPRKRSILYIVVPVVLLILCIIAGVVVWQLGIFQPKDTKMAIPKTTARMVVLEVTERKLTPLEINGDNIFDSGGAEEQALPGKR